MTRLVPKCSLVLLSIVLASCSKETPTKAAEVTVGGSSSAAAPVAAAPVAAVSASTPAPASGAVLQTQDANQGGIVADFTECRRKDGVLNLKLRLRNVSSKEIELTVINNFNFQEYYMMAANKKYFILKDSEGTYLAPAGQYQYPKIQPGQAYTWWAKYPAPPPDVKKITYITPLAPPFEDVPVADR